MNMMSGFINSRRNEPVPQFSPDQPSSHWHECLNTIDVALKVLVRWQVPYKHAGVHVGTWHCSPSHPSKHVHV
jgi:hypothetical protein